MVIKPIIDQSIVDEDLEREQILIELNELFILYSPRQKGDVTIADIAQNRGLSRVSARDFIFRIVKSYPYKYELVKIQVGSSNSTRWQWALRKK